MRLQNLLIKLFILLPFFITACEYSARQAYIDTFSPIAVREMHRSNIPASITLAQGILESASGEGELARKANNHFGIKCKGDWQGDTFYRIDDDVDASGKKVESCFRKYASVHDSYIDHTNFLVESIRYQDLFKFASWDYKNWAHGLKAKNYATDPDYAEKLIDIIETHQLNIYDLAVDFGDVVAFEKSNFYDRAITLEQNIESDIPTFSTPTETNELLVLGRIPGNRGALLDSEADKSDSPAMPILEPSERMRAIYREPNPGEVIPK
jgi:Mannosyl-glycoprotein endo-beta-N-acetylglucosaminidase